MIFTVVITNAILRVRISHRRILLYRINQYLIIVVSLEIIARHFICIRLVNYLAISHAYSCNIFNIYHNLNKTRMCEAHFTLPITIQSIKILFFKYYYS